jgi:hypothetical protein
MPSISKKTAEKIIFYRFKDVYEKEKDIILENIVHDESPDFIAINKNDDSSVGIEVTGVYQNKEEAMLQYWRQDGWQDFFVGDQSELIKAFNDVLSKKAKKSFKYTPADKQILAIYMGSMVFQESIDLEFMRPEIIIPENKFSEIWILIKSYESKFKLYRLQ